MKKILQKLFEQQTLSTIEAIDLLEKITDGSASDAQIVAAMSALKMRNITPQELNGFRKVLLDKSIRPELDGTDAIDVCGTGGDGKNTFNISTLAAIVIAGAGYKVIKHGNYGVSSLVGSSTILENYGYQFTIDNSCLQDQLNETNLCFLHAPLFHPALKRVAPIRKELGVRTFFNFLGPLVNPVQPNYQLTGVFNLQLLRLYKEILAAERKGFKVVHAIDGYDEVSLTGPFKIAGSAYESIFYPKDIKQPHLQAEQLFGGNTVKESLQIFKGILNGEGTAEQNAVVITNSALGIQCFDAQKTFEQAFQEAQDSLLTLKAKTALDIALKISQTVNA